MSSFRGVVRCGTCSNRMPASRIRISPLKCAKVSGPDVPSTSAPGRRLAKATNSVTVVAGKSLGTSMTNGASLTRLMRVMRSGSQGRRRKGSRFNVTSWL